MMKDSIEKNVKLSYESRHMEIERKSERILVEHVLYVGLFFLLLIATITDLRTRLIHDEMIIAGAIFVVVCHLFIRDGPLWHYFITGIGILLALVLLSILVGGQIGGGDIKLFSLIGLAVGWIKFLYVFTLSHVVAAIYIFFMALFFRKRVKLKEEIAFAPFILIGTVFTYVILL